MKEKTGCTECDFCVKVQTEKTGSGTPVCAPRKKQFETELECHAFPPNNIYGHWPKVKKNDWCGIGVPQNKRRKKWHSINNGVIIQKNRVHAMFTTSMKDESNTKTGVATQASPVLVK